MDNTIFKGFYDKFTVSTRPGRGGKYPFVPANDVTDRMNRLFQGNWCTEVTFQDTFEDGTVIVRVKVLVLDPESKTWFWHEGFGGHKDAGGEPGSSFKSAYSKALVNACRRWGVGLYLDDDNEITTTPTDTGMPGPKPVAALPVQELPPAPSKPTGPPVVTSPPVLATSKPPIVQEMNIQQVPPTTTMVQSTPEPLRHNESIPKIPEPIHGAPLNGAPIMGKAPLPSVKEPLTVSAPVSTTTETPSVDSISDVQKIAIQSLYDMRGYKYEDLAQQVLGSVPDVNTLTHDQAVSVIQYGNDLYKKNKIS